MRYTALLAALVSAAMLSVVATSATAQGQPQKRNVRDHRDVRPPQPYGWPRSPRAQPPAVTPGRNGQGGVTVTSRPRRPTCLGNLC